MRLKLALLLCLLIPVTISCATPQKGTMGSDPGTGTEIDAGIPLAPAFRIADIPIPAGFSYDRDHSYVYQDSEVEVGKVLYSGKEPIGEVAQFYSDEMPRYNWTLLNMIEEGNIAMQFEKEGKACRVLLTPKAGGRTLIKIHFNPKAVQMQP